MGWSCKHAWTLLSLCGAACTADTGLLRGGEIPDQGAVKTDGGAADMDLGTNPDLGISVDAGVALDAGSPSDLEQALVRAECRHASRCLRRYYFDAFGADLGCVESGGYGLGREARARVEAGRAVVDPAQLADCLAALESAACDSTQRAQACDRALIGTVAQGERCLDSAECAPGLRCRGLSCGTCQPALPTGQTCDADEGGCEGYCFTQIAGTPGTCYPNHLLEGEPCSGLFSDCEAPLYCGRENNGERRCRSAPQPGELCNAPGAGLACDYGNATCNDDGVCEWLTFVDPGEACDGDRLCRGLCGQGLCRPFLELGDLCVPGSGPCAGALGLCGFDGVCRPRPKDGEPCQGYDSCERGVVCGIDPPICTSRPWELCK